MGMEESATQVATKTIDALGGNPLMLGMLILMGVFLGFSAYQQHDGSAQNREMLIKILELRHEEIMEVFKRCTPDTVLNNPPSVNPVKEPF